MAQVRNYTWAAGTVTIGGVEVGKVVSGSFDESFDTIKAKSGCGLDPWANETVGRTISGSFEFNVYSKEVFSQLTGGTEASNGYHWIKDEAVTVNQAAGNTLAHTNGVLVDSVVVYRPVDGKTFIEGTGTPGVGEFQVTTGGELDWNAADNGGAVQVSYAYTTTGAEADKLTLASTDLPGYKTLVIVNCGRNLSSESKSYVVDYFPKVRITGINFAGGQDSFATYTANFEAVADSSGNIWHRSTEVA